MTSEQIIPQNSPEIWKFCGNGQIPQLGSKFRGLWKTVGPRNYPLASFLIHCQTPEGRGVALSDTSE